MSLLRKVCTVLDLERETIIIMIKNIVLLKSSAIRDPFKLHL